MNNGTKQQYSSVGAGRKERPGVTSEESGEGAAETGAGEASSGKVTADWRVDLAEACDLEFSRPR